MPAILWMSACEMPARLLALSMRPQKNPEIYLHLSSIDYTCRRLHHEPGRQCRGESIDSLGLRSLIQWGDEHEVAEE